LIDDNDFMKTLDDSATEDFSNASNADMALAISQLDQAQADQKTAYADFLPKVSGSADYGRSGASPDRGSNTYDVGLSVSVPLWEGGSQQADLKEAKGKVKEDQENFYDASQQEQVNIAKARAAIMETEDLRRSKTQERQTAQKALRIALHAQEIGSGTVLQVVGAKADLATAEDDYNEAQAAWVMAHIDLLHAQGRLRDLIKKGT
jgi:outer membrane protein